MKDNLLKGRFLIKEPLNSSETFFSGIDQKSGKEILVRLGGFFPETGPHPCLVSVLDRGVFKGDDYFIYEKAEGRTLDELIAEGVGYKTLAGYIKNLIDLSLFLQKERIGASFSPSQIIIDKDENLLVTNFSLNPKKPDLASIYMFCLTGSVSTDSLPTQINPDIEKDRDVVSPKLIDEMYLDFRDSSDYKLLRKKLIKTSRSLKRKNRLPLQLLILFLVLASLILFGYFSTQKNSSKETIILAPNLIGKQLALAREILTKKDLDFYVRKQDGPLNYVLRQYPMPGEPVSGSVVVWIGKGSNKIRVPDVIKLDREEARQILQEAGLVAMYERIPSDFRPGLVLKTAPRPGAVLSKDSTVTLFVAAPNGLPKIPDVVGDSLSLAKSKAYALGVGLRIFKRVITTDYPPDQVLKQRPAPGTRPISKTVKVWVATPPRPIPMPSLAGLKLAEAESILIDLGLAFSVLESKAGQPGVITRQDPAPGTAVDGVVKIWVGSDL